MTPRRALFSRSNIGGIVSKIATLAIVVVFLIVHSGCTAPIYSIRPVHVPTMKQGGDVQSNVSIGTSGYDAHLSISPFNHFMVEGGYSKKQSDQEKNANGSYTYSHGHSLAEAAAGVYFHAGMIGAERLSLQFTGGFASGKGQGSEGIFRFNTLTYEEYPVSADLRETFGQFVMLFETPFAQLVDSTMTRRSKLVVAQYGGVFRFSKAVASNFTSPNTLPSYENHSRSMMQVIGFLRTGEKNVFVEFQAGFIWSPLSESDDRTKNPNVLTTVGVFTSLGFHFNIF